MADCILPADLLDARWIWLEADRDRPVFARARRSFRADVQPERAQIAITCSGHYRLHVNGTPVGRGPAHASLAMKYYDVIDLTPLIRPGLNVVAVQLLHMPYATAHTVKGPPGLLCRLVWDAHALVSDERWGMSLDPAYFTGAQRRNELFGPMEVFDGRRNDNWTACDYDDAHWPGARVVDGSAWKALVPRGIPLCRERMVLPQAIVLEGEVEDREIPELPHDISYFLLLDVPVPPQHTRIDRSDHLLSVGNPPARISQPSPLDHDAAAQMCATIILDFGREVAGRVALDIEGRAGEIVDIAYSERLLGGRVPAVLQGVSYADRYILREGRQTHEVYDWKGFRYVQLTFRKALGDILLHRVSVTSTGYPLEPAGAFRCSDDLVTRIWQTGARTQELCAQDQITADLWREQEQWLGDGRLQLLILQSAFGERRLTDRFIRQFRQSQFSSGQLPCVSFLTDESKYIADYSLWWIRGILDVLLFNRDSELAVDCLPAVDKLLGWYEPYAPTGLLQSVPGWVFIDWAKIGKAGVCAPLNAIYAIALDAAAQIARIAARPDLAGRYRVRADVVAQAYHRLFWNERRRLYVDNVVDGKQTNEFSQHTQAITVYARLPGADPGELMLRTMGESDLVRPEPFFSFYLLEALGLAGHAPLAMEFLRQQWGTMIKAGATTFWEEWQVTGTFRDGQWLGRPRSHCHAWSAGPTAWLSRWVLGVHVPDFGGMLWIAPNICGLTEASGTVPTAWGPATVTWRQHDGACTVDVRVPPGVPVQTVDPPGFEGRTAFRITEEHRPVGGSSRTDAGDTPL